MSTASSRHPQGVSVGSDKRNQALWALAVSAYGAAGAGFVLLAAHLHGVPRYLLGAVGVIGVGIAALCVGSLIVFALGWGFFMGTFRAKPSAVQRCTWAVAAVVGGAVLGLTAYGAGPPGLVAGPTLLFAIVIALRVQQFDKPFINRRLVGFAAILATAALIAGLTIFL